MSASNSASDSLNLKEPKSFLILLIFTPSRGLNRGPSGRETNDRQMCQPAFLQIRSLQYRRFKYHYLGAMRYTNTHISLNSSQLGH